MSNINTQTIAEYNKQIANGIPAQQALEKASIGTNRATIALMQSTNGAKVETEQLAVAQKTSTLSARAQSVAFKALSVAGNMLLFLGISSAISAVVKGIDTISHSSENCKESAEKLLSSYKSALDTANSNAKKTEDLTEKYEILSKGVNNLGENISLTTDEYKEYNSIVNQIADMFPNLISGYTNEGTAILSLKGNVEDLTSAYKEAQKEAHIMLITTGKDSNGNDILKNAQNILNGDSSTKSKYNSKKEELDYINEFMDILSQKNAKQILLKKTGLLTEFNPSDDDKIYRGWIENLLGVSTDGARYIKDLTDEQISNMIQTLHTQKQIAESEIESVVNDIKTVANAFLMTNKDFEQLDEQSKSSISLMVNNLNSGIASGFKELDDIGEYVTKIINTATTNPEMKNAMVSLFSMDTADTSIHEIKKSVDDYIQVIAGALEEDPIELKARLGFDDIDSLLSNYEKITDSAVKKFSNNTTKYATEKNLFDNFAKENSINTQDELAFWNQCIEESKTKQEAMNKYLNTPDADKLDNKTKISNLESSITNLTSAQVAINDAIEEQTTTGTISADNLALLTTNCSDYEKILEKTAFGVSINTEKLRSYTKEQKDNIKVNLEDTEKSLAKQYNENSLMLAAYNERLRTGTDLTSEQKQHIQDLIEAKQGDQIETLGQIADLESLQIEYENTTSKYNAFMTALSSEDAGSHYDSIVSNLEKVKEAFENGDVGTDQFRAFVDYMSYADMSTSSVQELVDAYDIAMKKANDFFTESNSGKLKFLENLEKNGYATQNPDDSWNISISDLDAAAQSADISVDALKDNLQKLKDKGFELNFNTGKNPFMDVEANLLAVRDRIAEIKNEIQSAGETPELLDELNSLSATEQSIVLAIEPIVNKQEAIDEIQRLQEEIENTPIKAKIKVFEEQQKSLANQYGLDLDSILKLSTDETAVDNVENRVKNMDLQSIIGIDADVTNAQKAIDDICNGQYTAKIFLEVSSTSIISRIKSVVNSVVNGSNKKDDSKSGTSKWTGSAYANGKWTVGTTGKALVGELGQEIVVRNGQYYTVGDNGAEFVDIKSNDIVFNAVQSKDLLKDGKISTRGKALYSGSAYASGSVSGSGSIRDKKGNNIHSSSDVKDSKKKKEAEKEAKDTTKTFDWIEIALDRIQKAFDRLNTFASSVYKTFTERNYALSQEFDNVRQQIILNQTAASVYMDKANSVGLSAEYREQIHNGSLNIEDITDENLQNQIESYKEYYEKAMACADSVEELRNKLGDLAKERFELISSDFDNRIAQIKKQIDIVNGAIEQTEKKGHFVSSKYYEMMLDSEKQNAAQLAAQKEALEKSLQDSVASGDIKENTQEWYDMKAAIAEVDKALQDSNTSIIEIQNSIRQLKWDTFDYLQDSISKITSESDFLIDLLDNKDLHDDNGNMTDNGMAVAGLHGVNYNTHMNQADKYASEIAEIEKEIAKDPYNKDLIARKNELLEAQRASILAAEDEKEAIRQLVEEGINIQLDAMQKLIDKRKEALQSERDLYDYQKSISEKSKNITDIQKQLDAYQGDNSEETKSKIQSLKVSLDEAKTDLEETEYDKYISDQEQMLDTLYTQYEEVLNMRLDNVDALMAEIIAQVNDSSSIISDTIKSSTEGVGYTVTEEMKAIWNSDAKNVITMYGDNFINAITTVNTTIAGIKALIQAMVDKSNADAAQAAAAAQQPTPPQTPSSSDSGNSSGSDSSKGGNSGGFFIHKTDSYPKNKLRVDTSIVDRLKSHDFDSSMGARRGYYASMGFSGNYSGTDSQNIDMLDWMKSNGYKKGSKNITSDELNWTHDGELIFRPSDGAMLTPLENGGKVFTKEMTDSLWNMSQRPLVSPPDYSSMLSKTTSNSNVSIEIENINMHGVNDTEMFANTLKDSLKNNQSVRKIIQDDTLGLALGKNSLTRYTR